MTHRYLRLAPRAAAIAVIAAAWLACAGASAQAQTPVSVYPIAGTGYNLPGTQIAFRGVRKSQIGNLQVAGSKTGTHAGHLEGDSDGNGASFIPDKPFAAGETVTVTTGLDVVGAEGGHFSFTIATPAGPIQPQALPVAPAGSTGVQHFVSRPDLQPAAVSVTTNSAPASSEGDIFLAPQFGPAQNGPMILDPQGNLVWFHPYPVSQRTLITDFREQQLNGQPVLTWWQGGSSAGYGLGEGVIFDRNYREVAVVHAANGLQADLHEFLLTPRGDAYLFATSPVRIPGVVNPVIDSVVQEIDIKTGLLEFEWHALDHVSTQDSYFPPSGNHGHPWDPFHANSISFERDGSLVVSMRNTSAVYDVNPSTGVVVWTLGGKASSFKMGAGTSTWGQHDAVVQPDGTLTIFDDGAGPPTVHPYSRGIHESIDTGKMTATLISQDVHSPSLSANFEGSVQALTGGESFLGWGQQPYFSEYDSSGHQDFDGHFVSPTSSYRAYRFAWSAQPPSSPALAASSGADGSTTLSASWNGATDVASWRVLAGSDPRSLATVGESLKQGFETRIVVHSAAPYFAVQALGSSGQVLSTTKAVKPPEHLALYGHTAFVPADSGTGGIPASCFAATTCHITTTVYTGRTLIARTGPESIGAGSAGIIHFRLSSTGLEMLRRARNGRLPVRVSAQATGGANAGVSMNLVRFSTSGADPHRSISGAGSVRIIGVTEFVSSGWVGGILAGCLSGAPCHVSLTLNVAGQTIAHTGSEFLGANELGYLQFTLTPAGHQMLVRASGNQLATHLTLSDGTSRADGDVALVAFQ